MKFLFIITTILECTFSIIICLLFLSSLRLEEKDETSKWMIVYNKFEIQKYNRIEILNNRMCFVPRKEMNGLIEVRKDIDNKFLQICIFSIFHILIFIIFPSFFIDEVDKRDYEEGIKLYEKRRNFTPTSMIKLSKFQIKETQSSDKESDSQNTRNFFKISKDDKSINQTLLILYHQNPSFSCC